MDNIKLKGNAVTAAIVMAAAFVTGCGSDNPAPDPVGAKKADETRQAYIDSLNIPADQKAQMKSHFGGAAVPDPAAAARAQAAQGNQQNRR